MCHWITVTHNLYMNTISLLLIYMKCMQELFIAADWLNATAVTHACSVFLEEQLAVHEQLFQP